MTIFYIDPLHMIVISSHKNEDGLMLDAYPGTLPIVLPSMSESQMELSQDENDPDAPEPQLTPPEADPQLLSLDDWKHGARAFVLMYADMIGQSLTANYPKAEQQGWPEKLNEARALIVGKDAETPGLDTEAGLTGKAREDLAAAVIAAAKGFAQATGAIAAIRSTVNDSIDAIVSPLELPAIYAAAKAQAEAVLSQLNKA